MACQVGDYGSYGEALVMLGHSNTEIAGRHVKRVPVPYGTCIVNINPVGVDATFGQIMAVVEVMQECAARGMPIFLDPCNNKAAIEHEVNSRIQKIGGNSCFWNFF